MVDNANELCKMCFKLVWIFYGNQLLKMDISVSWVYASIHSICEYVSLELMLKCVVYVLVLGVLKKNIQIILNALWMFISHKFFSAVVLLSTSILYADIKRGLQIFREVIAFPG